MFKKFLAFLAASLLLLAGVAGVYVRYLVPTHYPVFIESFDHGIMTVDSAETKGTDNKFSVNCRAGSTLTITIKPERTEKAYYNLKKLVVNGEDVTKDVSMLQYKIRVTKKLTVLAYFKKGSPSGNAASEQTVSYKNAPSIDTMAKNEYLGSAAGYDFEDPSIIYDEKSGYYYSFGSSNKVVRSKDLVNWEKRTNYFPIPTDADNDGIMTFSAFPSVQKWAQTHGYDSDASHSSGSMNREPMSPEIIKLDSEYYLYFSLCKKQGANEAAIFCVKTDDLAYAIENNDWQDVGLVLSTCSSEAQSTKNDEKTKIDSSCATNPSVFTDEDGKLYMAYGSYFGADKLSGGIYLLELNAKTGLLSKSSSLNGQGDEISTLHGSQKFNTGKLIAKPGSVPALSKEEGSLIGACDVAYNADTKYYYLFLTYGVSDTNYNIRVARSKSVTGPYVDFSGSSMEEYSSSKSENQYSKGLEILGGYNFSMSSNGGVSYVDVGKASTGSPSVIKTENGKWVMALQSRAYYKHNDQILCGSIKLSADEEKTFDASVEPALEVRQLFFDENDWPLAVSEPYTDETVDTSVKQSDMEGNWDIVVLDKSANKSDYKAIERSVSQPVTILGSVAISKNDIDKKTKLSKLNFKKNDKLTYLLTLDGTDYTVYPTVAWDWELSEGAIVLTGISNDGKVIFGKKNYSSFMGVYTDAFYYVLSLCDEETASKYSKQMDKIKENPSQSAVNGMTKKMIKSILSK